MSKKAAPENVQLGAIFAPIPGFNSATAINRIGEDSPPKEIEYNSTTDDGVASLRSRHVGRTHAEIAAARSGDLPLGTGLSLRQPMAGQAENNQFPFTTDNYGKQRA